MWRSASPAFPPLADYRGQTDAAGYSLHVTVLAIADEIAAAAELIMNKLDARPVAIVRGYQLPVSAEHRAPDATWSWTQREDLFR